MYKSQEREYRRKYQMKNKDKLKKQRSNLYLKNKEEEIRKSKEYYATHKEQIKEYHRRNYLKVKVWKRNCVLKRKFGITIRQYNEMFDSQKGCCAICKTHQSQMKQTLAVDHNHTTGKVRGLLCGNCNNGLGRFKDSSILLDKARRYLDNG
jgi:hypothetical protein